MMSVCCAINPGNPEWREKMANFGIITEAIGTGTVYSVEHYQMLRIRRPQLLLAMKVGIPAVECKLFDFELMRRCEETMEKIEETEKRINELVTKKRDKRGIAIKTVAQAAVKILVAGGLALGLLTRRERQEKSTANT